MQLSGTVQLNAQPLGMQQEDESVDVKKKEGKKERKKRKENFLL